MKASQFASLHGLTQFEGSGYIKSHSQSQNILRQIDLGAAFSGDRLEESSIEVVLGPGDKFPFHKLLATETLKYLSGNDVAIYTISPDGKYQKHLLGKENSAAKMKVVIPSGVWCAVELAKPKEYAHYIATTRPGYHSDDAVNATREELIGLVGTDQEALNAIDKILPFMKPVAAS